MGIQMGKNITYRINNCLSWTSEEEKGTFNQPPVTLLRGYKMGLITISLGYHPSHIIH
jgi:hypothetical protein